MKGAWKPALLVLSVIVLLGVLLSYQLEEVSETEEVPPIAEVQRNRFVAAERLLEKLGVESVEIDGRTADFAGAGRVTVVWPEPRRVVSEVALEAAEAFVAAGGHLIVGAEEWHDPVLWRFGIDVVEHEDHFDWDEYDDLADDDEDEDEEDESAARDVDEADADEDALQAESEVDLSTVNGQRADDIVGPLYDTASDAGDANSVSKSAQQGDADSPFNGVAKAELPPLEQGAYADEDETSPCGCGSQEELWSAGGWLGEPPLHFLLQHDSSLSSSEPVLGRVGPTDQPQLLQIRWGKGWVTATSSLEMFDNDALDAADHAEALMRLVALPGLSPRVLFVRAQPGGLGAWLNQHAWRILLVAGVFIVLAMWKAMPRFGPVLADPLPQRRRLLDHLLASGRLLWSRGEHSLLAHAASAAALARIHAEYPHSRWLAEPAFSAFVQRRFQIDASLLTLLCHPESVRHVESLIALTRCCQQIHDALAPRSTAAATHSLYDR